MADTTTSLGELTFTRIFDAPRALVFECMIDPNHLTHFWGPVGTSAPLDRFVIDARPGGRFDTVIVNDADRSEYPNRGVFVEVVAPERLVWHEPDLDMTTTSTFTDLGDGRTEVRIHQSNVPEMFRSGEAQAGFQSSLDRFEAYLATLDNTVIASIDGIVITRIFDAPRELVFDAWITPASFAAWFGGPDTEIPLDSCEIDARPGGTWKATMVLPDAHTIDWHGTFVEVIAPERLVLTMADRPGDEFEPLTVTFHDQDGKTRMEFHQAGGHMDAEGYRHAGEGWMIFFDTMTSLLASTTDT